MPFAENYDEHRQIKDHRSENQLFGSRILISFICVLALFSILLGRFYELQVVHFQNYATKADSNRIQVQPVPPTRGLMFDRNGILLADNRPSYTLSVVKERAGNLEQLLDALSPILPISDDDRSGFYKGLNQRRRPYEAVPLRYRLTEEEIAKISVNEYRLDGVEIEAQLVRYYPHGELFAHAIGYVGRINERELNHFSEDDFRRYSGTHSIGKIGLEKSYQSDLLGEVGSQHVEANAHGRVLRVLERIDPVPGKDLYLHMDLELQKAAALALHGNRGAVVAIEVATGGVLALVSAPSYDPNLFVTGISYADYEVLNQSRDLPLFNRTIQGQYPPGSTLKPILGLGGLQNGLITPEWHIRDPGYYRLGKDERFYRDWKKWGHGNSVDLTQAIVESCDTFFYDLAFRMGIDRMHPVGDAFGLGKKTGIDVPNERSGLWPSRLWKKAVRGLPWFPGDSLNVSIGQGDVLATPLQLGVLVATIASKGKLHPPKLVKRIGQINVNSDGEQTYQASAENWDYITSAMKGVVHSSRGTAKIISGASYTIAGKTGTAQVIGIAQDEKYDRDKIRARNRDHALFIAYAPVTRPEIAVAVIVENGEHGSSTAAPVAREVFDAWFKIEAARQNRLQEKFVGETSF